MMPRSIRLRVGLYALLLMTSAIAPGATSAGDAGALGGVANAPQPRASVAATLTVADIDAGNSATCSLISDGSLRCWGAGLLGYGATHSAVPTKVTGISTATSVDTSGFSACALLADQSIKCWGDNSSGQLGDGTTTSAVRRSR